MNPAGSWPQTPAEVVDRLPLLTAAEEVELAHAIEAGVLAGERLELARADVVDDPLLEQELCALVQLGAQAHERMVLANLRLVHFWARRRLGAGATGALSFEDLVSEGTFGLLRGVQKFDFTLGFKFSTYASWWIRQWMQRAVARSTAATIDHRTLEQLACLYAAEEDLHVELHRQPLAGELAERMGTTVRHVQYLRQASQRAASLDAPLTGRGGLPAGVLGDLLADSSPDGLAGVITADLALQVQQLLRQLPLRERRVLTLRFGLTGEPHSVEQAAAALGVTQPMVRSALQSALSRLRNAAGVDALHIYLEEAA